MVAQFEDILVTYSRALAAQWPLVMLWVAVFLVIAHPRAQIRWEATPRRVRIAVTVAGLGAALVWAFYLASMFDDAYISLRYARNLARGNGLVFNVDERVEGYTNFLWTVILAGGLKVGVGGETAALTGCLAAFAAELLLVFRLSRILSGTSTVIPLASIVLGASYTFASYGTTGMETMLSALLLTAALERALVKSFALAGLAAVVGMLTHPDAVLFAGGLGIAILIDPETRRSAWRFAAPIVVIFTPYFLWRWNYYGDFFPNTYYAKSGDLTYFSQGFIYQLASSLSCGLWSLLPLAIVAMWKRPSHLLTRWVVFGAFPYLIYVAKIGGDFMLGRLLVSLLPVFALLAELGLRDLIANGWQSAAALLAISAVPVHLISSRQQKWFMADERTIYSLWEGIPGGLSRAVPLTALAQTGFHPLVGELMTGLTGYESDLPMVDELGLTDRNIAHQPLKKRGRPGHEKLATPEYLKSRGVLLSFIPIFPGNDLARVYLNHQPFYLTKYDPALVAAIKSIPGSDVPDLPAVIDEFIVSARAHRPDTFARDVRFFDEFYFSVNRDPDRREAIRQLMNQPPSH